MITYRKSDAHRGGRRVAALSLVATLALALAACSSSASSGSPAAATAPAASATGAAVSTQATSLGVILVDGQGRTVYEFANDTNGVSACNGACAANWPPVAAPSPLPTSLPGVTGQLGSITRQDGTSQLTVAGHPLYTFAGDSAAGQTNGQGKTLDGGLWTVSSAAGAPVTAAAPVAPTSAPTAATTPGY
jgi:predicted lipoprotein with Yx(FWY)xxD motif